MPEGCGSCGLPQQTHVVDLGAGALRGAGPAIRLLVDAVKRIAVQAAAAHAAADYSLGAVLACPLNAWNNRLRSIRAAQCMAVKAGGRAAGDRPTVNGYWAVGVVQLDERLVARGERLAGDLWWGTHVEESSSNSP